MTNSTPFPPSFVSKTSSATSKTDILSSDNWDAPIKIPAPAPAPSKLGKSHQRSRTAIDLPPLLTTPSRSSIFLPFKSSEKNRSPSRSPPKSPTYEVDDLDYVDAEELGIQVESKANKFASWFSGTSQPLSIGLLPSPTKEGPEFQDETENMDRQEVGEENLTRALPSRPTNRLQQRQSGSPSRPTLASTASRFSFFRSKPPVDIQSRQEMSDELVKLDINSTLFPAGSVQEFSPAAFKNLQMNAEGALQKFQTAYTQALRTLRDVTSERNVHADELEAAQTRNEHLKLQLTDMAEKAIEQEKAMKAMAEELAFERQRRSEEEAFRRRTLKMVPLEDQASSEDSKFLTPKRSNRNSTTPSLNESEAESDISAAESIFSNGYELSRSTSCASPTPTTPFERSPEVLQSEKFTRQQGCTSPSKSTKLVPITNVVASRECQNCHGMSSSEAWAVVHVLKEESKALKDTISHLEAGLDSSLDFVSRLI
ncbi:hypothetical protein UCRPC4_g05903 [Phaeomoniella chlamydospora]|uniref:Uncharacterized protein n=1 Tax=Phaeomoniella chlamydospora TaxID=158046 RepID=A0A0G2E2H1_PHACM|nr:hypothetical protein UCRPC4_g05903 [Phaeomoniella chlamydospora]